VRKLRLILLGNQVQTQVEDKEFGLFKTEAKKSFQIQTKPGATNLNAVWSKQVSSIWVAV
jgi:hypothetical protein